MDSQLDIQDQSRPVFEFQTIPFSVSLFALLIFH